jgi:23S rRNA (cytidine2498-2'-O)-methyltransferase
MTLPDTPRATHLVLSAEDSEAELRAELAQSFPGALIQPSKPSLLEAEFDILPDKRLPYLAFARQLLPDIMPARAESIRGWAGLIVDAVAGVLPDSQPWSLHIEPHYGARTVRRMGARAWHSARRGTSPTARETRYLVSCNQARPQHAAVGNEVTSLRSPNSTSDPQHPTRPSPPDTRHSAVDASAGRQRCRLTREALMELMQRKRRHLLRQLRGDPLPFTTNDSLVQLLLTAPDTGFISVAAAPLPFEQRHLLSPFPKGEVPPASDKTAPSRAFAKLVEAELRLGRAIRAGETCADLGASPGSWTWVAAGRGAKVIAVDRSPLREDLMRNRQVRFQEGDAFRFRPDQPVDWLLCDVIAAPERTAELLLEWLRRGWCRHFVVTVKLKDRAGADALAMLKRELPPLTQELFLTKLCANKKEMCAFGRALPGAVSTECGGALAACQG